MMTKLLQFIVSGSGTVNDIKSHQLTFIGETSSLIKDKLVVNQRLLVP
jgi:hypothetical protein